MGLLLTLLSVFCWGIQPLAIAIIVHSVPSTALAFYKISTAALSLTVFLWTTGALPNFRAQGLRVGMFLAMAAISLSLSYVLYNSCFRFITPDNAQIFIQLSRILLALIGIFVFKERFVRAQWLGLILVIGGLYLFFHDQVMIGGSEYGLGVMLAIASSACWAIYATFQKLLLRHYSALQVLVFIYLGSTILLAPYAEIKPLVSLHGFEWFALAIICLTNVLAFATFSEALNRWEASKVGAISCLTPFVTIALTALLAEFSPLSIKHEALGLNAFAAVGLVVGGSILVSIF